MSALHRVQQGEYLSMIAVQYGFRNYETIWNHARNAALKTKRKSPNVLLPGDMLFIPDKHEKEQGRGTDLRHAFEAESQTTMLQVVMQRFDKEPIGKAPCRLKVGDDVSTPISSDAGLIAQEIRAGSQSGSLRVADPDTSLVMEIEFKIGHLDPADEQTGWMMRLRHLGYDPGAADPVDEMRLQSAIEEFQCENGLKVDGVCGPHTQAKLRLVHGC